MAPFRHQPAAGLLFPFALIATLFGVARAVPATVPETRHGPAAEADELLRIFTSVAQGIRYEPYRGAARGGAATATMLSGNSFDQSLLLAERLRASGYQVRFARGTLGPENLRVLLRGMYPPRITGTRVGEELAPFAPEDDPELRRAAEDHVWVEVFQGKDWLPLDPSFPWAVAGASYAPVRETTADLRDEDYQTLTLVLHQEDARGRHQELARLTGRVSELALAPITLVTRAVPVSAAPEPEAGGSPSRSMGMFGEAVTGDASEEDPGDAPPPEEVVGIRLARSLDARGTVADLPTAIILRDGGEAPRREWLVIETRVPGESPRTVERDLARSDRPVPDYRRHTITVLNGPVSVSRVSAVREEGAGLARLDARGKELPHAGRLPGGDPEAAAMARRVGRMGHIAGAVSGHVLNLLFARDSDALAEGLAEHAGAVLSWPRPRVLISSLALAQADAQATLSLDLRVNDIGIHPHPGLPSHLGPLLQTARGLQDAALEGALVARAADGGRPLSAGAVIDAAVRGGDELRVLRAGADLDGLGLPLELRRQIEPTLGAGYDVALPGRAIEVESRPRWAWLRIEPERGGLVAVMDGGEHQGMTQYTVSGSSIGLNDKMGLAIGAIVGATTTEFAIAGGVLKYGGATDEMVQEVERQVKSLLCNSCRSGAGASASADLGGAGASLGCFTVEKKKTVEAGVKVDIPFCESYRKGFECSSGLLLGGLKGESLLSADAGVSGPQWSPPAINLGCD